uniref:Uncharacterized protein n=1 Tax=Meloidogyne incognita TaxID=6306 RepID=A0A914MKC1_MELIC
MINSIHCSIIFYSEQNDNGTKIFGTNKENIQPTFVAQKPASTKAKKSASFAENISTDIPQNLNTSSVNTSSTTGGLKGILKKVNVPLPDFPQTNSLKPVRVDTDTHITAEYSPQSLDNPNSPQVTYRINTQVKVDYEPQNVMKRETLKASEKTRNKVEKTQEVKKRKRNFQGKIKWSKKELNDLTYLIHHFYDRASNRPSCDLSKFPLFVEYIDQNEYPFLEMDPKVAEKIISNDKANCVFIHYYKYEPNKHANDGTLLDAIFSSKGISISSSIGPLSVTSLGHQTSIFLYIKSIQKLFQLKFSGDEIKKRVRFSEDGRRQIYDAVPLRVVLQTLKEVSVEGDNFFVKNQELMYFYMD